MSSNSSTVGGGSPVPTSGNRKRKAAGSYTSMPGKKPARAPKKCDRKACELINADPFCFVQATDRCAQSGYTSRWYHLSAGQHFCNECFEYFYRINKPGHTIFATWSSIWEREAGDRILPGPKTFLMDQYLPVWVQCTCEGCGKWRKLPPSIDLRHVKQGIVKCTDCSLPEDKVVSMVTDPQWINTVSYTPLLRYTILAPLLSEYVPEGVGISPTTVHHVKVAMAKRQEDINKQEKESKDEQKKAPPTSSGCGLSPVSLISDPLHPFNHPQEGPRARAFTPDNMEPEEIQHFPEYYKLNEAQSKWHSPRMELYCIIRNIILALWFNNHKEYLTVKKCIEALSLRGIVRIWCTNQIPRILQFLTEQGHVNAGVLKNMPRPFPITGRGGRGKVLVIGAGAAGLSAAYHLRNHGYQTQILEASGRVGGRVKDDYSLGPCVGLGAMFITGICNNPFTLLSRQLGVELRMINEEFCELINEQGQRPDKQLDLTVERHYNATLDRLAEWRARHGNDVSLEKKLGDLHQQLVTEERQGKPFSEEELRILDFHYSNLEFACGATLDKISSFNWDHNDNFAQFSGCHALLADGYMAIFSKLAEGMDIHYDTVVKRVEVVTGRGVRVVDSRGNIFTGDKIIVTVPLAVLKTNVIKFIPPLPERKVAAINNLGAGLVEKVALKFSSPFWRKAVGSADFFGHVASARTNRGMFGVFYDFSTARDSESCSTDPLSTPPSQNTNTPVKHETESNNEPTLLIPTTKATPPAHILVTTVSGEALNDYQRLSDAEIVSKCVSTLRLMFPEEDVPKPIGSIVSRWGADPFAQMSYSYAAVGSSGDDYDALSEEVEDIVFFGGEATNRQHPQTVTGAYLSGLREAYKIIRLSNHAGR